jgi:protein ImuB
LVVECPDWPVIAAGVPPDTSAAVVFANRVVAVTPAAHDDHVEVGLRRREAQGRSPGLVVVERDEAREARTFEPVVQALEVFTPRIEVVKPGVAAFPTRGPSRYFRGDDALARSVCEQVDAVLDPFGWAGQVRVGVADGPFTARRAARRADAAEDRARSWCVVAPGKGAQFLAPLSVGVLDRPDLADVLRRLGLPTLGDFAALDPADVLARFSADGELAHRLARGLDERPPSTAPPPVELQAVVELDPPAERVDTAAFVAKSLADELHERLEQNGLSCTRVLIAAETEHGEHLERLWRHEGALSAAAVADRVRWQLDGWLNGSAATRPSAGITRLALVPDEVTAARGRQLGFWGGETASADRAARAVARVQGLLGPDAVHVPEWRGGRGPGERVGLVPAAAVDLTVPRTLLAPSAHAPWPGQVPTPSPATVHEPPVPAEVVDRAHRPVGVSGRSLLTATPAEVSVRTGPWLPVEAWAGPWPAEERWWDPDAARRRARFQMVAGGRALLLAVEGGRWWLEATYD